MALRFGTDGVRGVANAELTPELALVLGRAAARVLAADRAVIGRDPRRSGPMIEGALAAGFASAGCTVDLVGVVPTPAVAHLSETGGGIGAVISASHNNFADNGIKLFAPGGRKLPDDVEEAIETELERELAGDVGARPSGTGVGVIRPDNEGARVYVDHLVSLFPDPGTLTGLDIALDCANGATSAIAPEVFDRLGARVVVRAAAPDGSNINDRCGATHPEPLADAVRDGAFELGLAFDGDGDRLIAVDHTGRHRRRRPHHRHLRARPRTPGAAPRPHRRRDGHDEPRLPAGHGEGRHPSRGDRGGRPLRAGGAGGRCATRWVASRAGTWCSPTSPRRVTASSPASSSPTWCNGPVGRWPSWPRRP